MGKFGSVWTQMFPPPPTFTAASSLPRQDGRVFIVTGGNSGVGLALIKLLYPTGARIYMASRSRERAEAAIREVFDEATAAAAAESTGPRGTLAFLPLDLDDLASVQAAAATFTARESRLDMLWNNAGAAAVPVGSRTAQGVEAHVGANCVAPLLFTQELLPLLRAAAAASPPGATRVLWTASIAVEGGGVPACGVDTEYLDRRCVEGKGTGDPVGDYAMSKAGNWLLAVEGARRWGKESEPGRGDGVVSAVLNPGQVRTRAQRHMSWLFMLWFRHTLYPPEMGAHTLLFAGFSPELGLDARNGAYVLPFGRLRERHEREDIVQAIGNGRAREFLGVVRTDVSETCVKKINPRWPPF